MITQTIRKTTIRKHQKHPPNPTPASSSPEDSHHHPHRRRQNAHAIRRITLPTIAPTSGIPNYSNRWYGLEGAVKFGVYESLKPLFLNLFSSSSSNSGGVAVVVDPTEPYLFAALAAGALASLILCPMEETRIRLVTDPSFGSGLLDGLPKLLKQEGVLAPFQRGILPMLSKQVPYTMGKQVSFDVFAGMLYGSLVGASAGGWVSSLLVENVNKGQWHWRWRWVRRSWRVWWRVWRVIRGMSC